MTEQATVGMPTPAIQKPPEIQLPPPDKQIAVTTFSVRGWEDYGREGMETFIAHFPGKIIAYHEDDQTEFPDGGGKVEWRPLLNCEGLDSVLQWCFANPVLQGVRPEGEYSYQFDCYKFCRKVFAQVDAGLRFWGWMWWLDADSRLLKDVPDTLIRDILKTDCTGAMGRLGFHIESGVVVWNTAHPECDKFLRRYRELFLTGEICGLPGWHDCWAYQKALRDTHTSNKNLTPAARGTMPVMELSPFNGYIEHDKGLRKYARQKPQDILEPRSAPTVG